MKKRLVAVALASVAVGALSACGSSGASSTQSSGASASAGGAAASSSAPASGTAATGKPLVFATDGSDNGNGYDQYQFQDGFIAWAKQVSASGGLGGRPVTVQRCNDQGDPVQSTACARQQIASSSVIASMGFSSYSGYAAGPLFKAAGMAYVAPYPVSSADFSVLPAVTTPGTIGAFAGLPYYLAAHGSTKFGLIRTDVAATQTLVSEVQGGLAGTSGKLVADIATPLATTDYSSAISQAMADKVDVLLLGVQTSAYVPIFEAAESQGYTGAFAIPGTAASLSNVIAGQKSTNVTLYADADFPDVTTSSVPAIVQFRAAMAAADYPASELGQAAMSGYETGLLYGQVVQQVGAGKVTRSSFLSELSTAEIKGVPLMSAAAGAGAAPSNARSVINPVMYVTKYQDGQPQTVGSAINLKSVIENIKF